MTSDRGLCGAVHSNIGRMVRAQMKKAQEAGGIDHIKIVCVGDKSKQLMQRSVLAYIAVIVLLCILRISLIINSIIFRVDQSFFKFYMLKLKDFLFDWFFATVCTRRTFWWAWTILVRSLRRSVTHQHSQLPFLTADSSFNKETFTITNSSRFTILFYDSVCVCFFFVSLYVNS